MRQTLDLCVSRKPVGREDSAIVARIRQSENNRRLNEERFGAILTWIKKLGIVSEDYDWFDPVTGPPVMPQMQMTA